jgi:hypothetical protein
MKINQMDNMIKTFLLSIAILLISAVGQSMASEPLVAYKSGDLWHFIDHSGNEMFRPLRLDDVKGYKEGYFLARATIKNKKHWVYIDKNGKVPIAIRSDIADYFNHGRARIVVYTDTTAKRGKFGFIDTTGKFVIPLRFDDATDFSEGLAYVLDKENDVRGYINPEGEMIIGMENAVGYDFSEGMAAVSNSDFKVGYMNKSGEMVIDMKYDEPGKFSEGYVKANNGGRFGFIDREGRLAIDQIYDDVKPFSEGRAFVGKIHTRYMSHWGMIDTAGNMIIDFLYDDARNFSEGLASIKLDGRWLFIDNEGNNYFGKDFDYCDSFVNELAWISSDKENKQGYINKKGELAVKLPYAEKFIDLRLNREVR